MFQGILFTGIMITDAGPKVLEYNVRFGDPETQSLIPLLTRNTDLARVCLSCTNATLIDQVLEVQQGYACNVVIASAGYPGDYESGDTIDNAACSEGKLQSAEGIRPPE
jgi:phosphoribosylamine--glycine ligase/phosphoribosylformylglycinamidine cyclo-ligase